MFRFRDREQTLPELIFDGLVLFIASFPQVWLWALVVAVISSVMPGYFLNMYLSGQLDDQQITMLIIISLLTTPIAVFFSATILHRIYVVGAGEELATVDTLKKVFNKIIPLTVASLIITVITMIGYILFFFPGLFLSVMLIFTIPLMLLDDCSIFKAIKLSIHLVWHHWWRTFSVLLIPLAIAALVAVPVPLLQQITAKEILAHMAALFVIAPMIHAFTLNVFYDSKLRHHLPLHLPNIDDKKSSKKRGKKASEAKPAM